MFSNSKTSVLLFLTFASYSYGSESLESEGRFLNVQYLRDVIPFSRFMQYILGNETANNTVACGLACFNRHGCITSILRTSTKKCYLLKTYLGTLDDYSAGAEEEKYTKMMVASAVDPCQPNPCHKDSTCKEMNFGYQCICPHNRTGEYCNNPIAGKSCLDIMKKYGNLSLESGPYNLVSSDGLTSFVAYCDMKFGEGGWTRVLNVVADTTNKSLLNSEFLHYDNLNDVKSMENFVLKNSAIQQLRQMNNFTEIRFKCKSTASNTMIHIQTNVTAVIDYLTTGNRSNRPIACGSFTRFADDNSFLAGNCNSWSYAKWGIDGFYGKDEALAYAPFFVYGTFHWHLSDNRFECDTEKFAPISLGDFWEVYVK